MCGPTTSARSTRARTRSRSARPRASTSPCRGRRCATTSPRSCRSPKDRRSVFVVPVGRPRPTSAPPTPTTTARSTIRSARPTDVEYLLGAINRVVDEPLGHRPTSSARGPGSGRSCARRAANAPPTSRAGTVCTCRRQRLITITGGKLTTYRRMAADTVDAAARRPRQRRGRRDQAPELVGADGFEPTRVGHAESEHPRAPRGPLRHARRRGARPRRAATPSSRSRSSPACRTCGPRPSTRCATRWRARSTTCSPGAPAPGCSHATRRPRPPRRSPRCSPPSSGGTRPRPPARSSAYRSAVEHERRAADLPETALDASLGRRSLRRMQTNRGAPTPPIAFGGPAVDDAAHLAGSVVEVDDAVVAPAARRVRATVTTRCRAGQRGQPRLVAAGDDLGARRPGRGPGGRVVARPATRTRSRRCCASATSARVPVTAAAGAQRRVRRERARRTAVSCSTCCALDGIVDVDDDVDGRSTCVPARSATCSRTSCGRRTASRVGHWPQSIDALDRRRMARLPRRRTASTRYGKIEDIVVGLDVVLADGRIVTTGGAPRAAVGPDLTQLFVGSEGTLGVITGARLRLHPAPTAERRAAYGFDVVRRRARRLPAHPAPRRHARGAAPLRRHRRRPQLRDRRASPAARARRGRRGDRRRRRMAIVREECAPAATLDGEALVGRWLEHRNDVSALEALISTRLRRRHDGDRGTAGARCRRSTTPPPRRFAASSTRSSRRRTSRTRTPTARACTSRSRRSHRPRSASRYYRAAWDAGTRAVLAARRRAQPPPRRRPQPGPLRARRARRGVRRARRGEARARPATASSTRASSASRARSATPPGRDAASHQTVSILVVDVGTSSVRAAVVDARRADRRPSTARPLLPDSPAPGLVEFDATAMADDRARPRPPGARPTRGPVAAVGIANQRGVDRRVGPRDRRARSRPGIGWQDLRTVGRCLELRAARARGRAERSAHQARVAPRRRRSRIASRDLCVRHRRHVDRVDAVRRRAARDRRDERADHRPAQRRRTTGGTTVRSRRCASPSTCCRPSSTRPASSATATALPGAPPIAGLARRPAGVAAGPGLRAPGRRQDHVRHRRHARPRARPQRPSFADRGERRVRSRS